MKKYFYNKESGEYAGMTNSGGVCPDDCQATDQAPEHGGQMFDGDQWIDGKTASAAKPQKKTSEEKQAVYAEKIASFSDKQIQGALIRAKGFKHELLMSEKAKRES
jgi:hypothetical protein